jgi:hypothetical protein
VIAAAQVLRVQQVVGDGPGVSVGNMFELVPAADVPQRPEPVDRASVPQDPLVAVNTDPAVLVLIKARVRGAEQVPVGDPPGCDKDEVDIDGGGTPRLVQHRPDRAVRILIERGDLGVRAHVPLPPGLLGEGVGDGCVEVPEELPGAEGDGDVGSERTEDVREFGCDVSSADDEQAPGLASIRMIVSEVWT